MKERKKTTGHLLRIFLQMSNSLLAFFQQDHKQLNEQHDKKSNAWMSSNR